jgi:hypothetical protein
VRLAQRAPAYGGMFFDFDDQGNRILYVYLTDLSQEEAVKQAIIEIFGPRWLELPMYPREIPCAARAIQLSAAQGLA